MRGNLHLRDPRHVSFHVIKSYLLHAFEHPEQHDEAEQRRMAREIFDEPRLHRCLQLSDQPDAFLQSYLQELCADYVRIFILPDASHCRSFLGFTMPGTQAASMAVPAYDVLHNIFLSPDLTQTEQRQLAGAFYRAYRTQMNGHTQPLDERLGNTEKAPVQQIPASPLPSIGSVSSASLPDLAAVFGAQVPFVSLSGSGTVQDVQAGARLLTWQEDSGLTITAVQPASQAQLLRYDTITPDSAYRWSIQEQTALVAHDGSSACAYYATQDASYALYLPSGGVQALESLMTHLSFTDP